MLTGKRVAVVVPAHNEGRLIQRTLTRIPAYVDLIIVVDDGSHDQTSHLARSADPRVVLCTHGQNRGVGAAIATGYRAAFERGADVAAVMAGDDQMDPSELQTVLTPVVSGRADYCQGDRLSYPSARKVMPVWRWLGNHALTLLTRHVVGLPVRDSQCGYNALSARGARRLHLENLWPRYGYPNDLLGQIKMADLRLAQVTVRPVYADEESGIGIRHALFVVPYVLARVTVRRLLRRDRQLVLSERSHDQELPAGR